MVTATAAAVAPLSDAQRGMWFLERMAGRALFVDPMTLRLDGPLDVAALRWSLTELVERHGALRTTFPTERGQPVQAVGETGEWSLPIVDLAGLEPAEQAARCAAMLRADTVTAFDIRNGPCRRATLIRLGPTSHVLRVATHHLVSDAWSWWRVLWRELERLYAARVAGRPADLAPVAAHYVDFVDWQRDWSAGPGGASDMAYWQRQLDGSTPLPSLSMQRPASRPGPSGTIWHTFPDALYAQLRTLAAAERVTLFMVLLAAFQALLSRYADRSDIIVGTRAAVRSRPEFQTAVGYFVNLLALRVCVERQAGFRRLLHATRTCALGAYAHRNLPFERVLEQAYPATGARPLISVLFSFQSTPEVLPDLHGLGVALIDHDPQTAYGLDLVCYDADGALRALLTYDEHRFAADDMRRVLADLERVLTAIAAKPDETVDGLLQAARVGEDA